MPQRRRLDTALAVVVAVLCCVVLAALSAPASANRWNFESLDGNAATGGRVTADVGEDAASLVFNNQPHVFYLDNTNDDLRHAWWTGTAWAFETLDGNSTTGGRVDAEAGSDIAVTLWNNQPHVFYRDVTNDDLRHAWWTGSGWAFEALDGSCPTTTCTDGRLGADVGAESTAVVWNNQPHVFYRDVTNLDMRHAWWTGSRWAYETLDGNSTTGGRVNGNVGRYNTAVVWNNQPHTFYLDFANGDLRHAWWDGRAWRFETLDGNCPVSCAAGRLNGIVGFFNAATVWNNQPHVFYSDFGNSDLRHAWWTGSTWQFETLDGNSTTGGRVNSLVANWNAVTVWNNQPHVWYFDQNNGDQRHAWWTGSTWAFEALDGSCTTPTCTDGRVNSIVGTDNNAIVWNNQPHTFYHDTTGGDLRHSWFG